jgi:threonine/homoserine/homoserine lactone efflux protein
MSAITWALFIPACFAINMAPGPNNMLAFSNAARFGFNHAMLGAFGRLVAFALMIALVAIGLGAILAASETAFTIVKWLGAAYLVYVGIKLLRSRFVEADEKAQTIVSVRELARHEFFLAAGNPKAIATFTAFFPQFLDPAGSAAAQLMAMGGAFLAMEVVAIAIFAAGGRAARGMLQTGRMFGWLNKGVGAFLVGSGISLAISSR